MYYEDENGMALSGENVQFEVASTACWQDCNDGGNWATVFSAPENRMSREVQILDRNAYGAPTKIRWDVVIRLQYLPIGRAPAYAFSVRYLNDPGDAAANYSVFALNGNGGFGSCHSDDSSCLWFETFVWGYTSFQRLHYALVCDAITIALTAAWIWVVCKRGRRGLLRWSVQQKWTLVLAVGVVLKQNPVHSMWLLWHREEDGNRPNRFFQAITSAGLCTLLVVAAFWADW